MFKNGMKWTMAVALVALLGVAGFAMTADEILDRMEEEGDKLAEGSMIGLMRFENTYRDGTTAGNVFGMLSKPDFTLIYFVEPADVTGTIFLTHEIDDGNDSRMWLYLPLLGIPKELVSDEERGGSFAGSSMSYDDLGGGNKRDEFVATLTGEEDIVVQGETRTAYVIESVSKPDFDHDHPRSLLWVDAETFIMLKSEGYNDLGNLDSTVEVTALIEFEGMLTFAEMLTRNVTDESSTVITVEERRRPEGELSDDLFQAENLPSFDPEAWGF